MSKWFVFNLQPLTASSVSDSHRNYTKDDLWQLHNQISEWLNTNKQKTAKLQLISLKNGKGGVSWDNLHEQYPAAFLKVKLRSARDATLFKIFYSEYVFKDLNEFCEKIDLSKIILPLFRRVMPTIIANEIIGVQPMTAPVGIASSLKSQYAHSKPKNKSPFANAWEKVKKELDG
jgi:hypothetical protein